MKYLVAIGFFLVIFALNILISQYMINRNILRRAEGKL